MIPFGWYYKPIWEQEYGENWALKLCLDWFDYDGRRQNFAADLYKNVHCPCVIDQAFADFGRFYPLVDCDAFGDSYCYAQQGASHCVISAQFMLSGAAQVCCYGPEGYLMFSDDYEWNDQYLRFYGAGVPYRAHIEGSPPFKRPPFVPGLSQFHNDQMPFEMCCKWAGHCEFYYWRRQSDGCQDYRPPTLGILFQMHPAFAYGHGHFITFDGLSYTFPGKGYFVLAKMASPYTKMQVQVRMEQPPEPIWGSAARSTIITGVVAQVNGSSKVEIYARKDHRRWKYRMDVYVDNMRVFFDMSFKRHYNFNGLMIRVPGRVVATETVEVMFTSGVGLRVNEFEGSLSVEIALPDNYNATLKHLYPGQREFQEDAAPRTRSCNDVHQTYGLLGTFNGDPDDDLTVMNGDTCAQGSRISQPPSVEELRALYTGFGMKWEADGKSVPVMFNTKRRALYNPGLFASDEGYIPAFDIWRELESDVTMFQSLIFTQEEVKLACQGNWNCQFDYVNTGRREIAMNTLNTEKKYKSTKDSAEQLLISCGPLWKGPGVLKYPPTGNYLDGITVTFQCRPDFFLHGEQQRTCVNGTWTPGWWAWCRSRSFEIFLKWMVGLTTSIIIIMIIAVIFLLCFLRRKKQKHEGDRHPEALHKIDDVAHDEHTAAGFQQRHPTPEQVPIVTPQNEQKFDQGYYTAPPPGAEHNFVQQPVFSGTMPNARYDSPPAYGNEGDAGVGHQSSF